MLKLLPGQILKVQPDSHLPLELVERRRLGFPRVVNLPDLLRRERPPRRRRRWRRRQRCGILDNCKRREIRLGSVLG